MSGQDAGAPSPNLLHAQAWAELHEAIDLQLSPLGLPAIEALGLAAGGTVLDIGCGAGQTLLQLAGQVGPHGRVIGVDLAPLLLGIAGRRVAPLRQVELIEADAQTLDLPAGSADAAFSRFGVMSFRDPVAAFRNVRRILRPAGVLAFTCWRALEENELDHLPLRAAGLAPCADAAPFSFADPAHVRRVLHAAGFGTVILRPHDQAVSCGGLDATAAVLLRVGALGKLVRETPALRAAAEPRLRAVLAARGDPSRVWLSAAVWIVAATG